VSQQVSEKQIEPTGKKSIALAVTLVILVISVMLNVLFSTKNMSYGQDLKVVTGEQILKHLATFNEKNVQLLQYNYDIVDFSPENNKLARLTAAHAVPLVAEVKHELSQLIEIGQNYEKAVFTAQATEKLEWMALTEEQLRSISNSEGELTQGELDELNGIIDGSERLSQIIKSFNFNVEGNRNAMIRIGNGFGWLEQVQALEQFVNAEGIQ